MFPVSADSYVYAAEHKCLSVRHSKNAGRPRAVRENYNWNVYADCRLSSGCFNSI